jgi:serine/threonine protein kinase
MEYQCMNSTPLYCDACGAANRQQARFCFECGQSLPGIASTAEQTVPNALIRQCYHVIAQVGKGGFGAVYKAEDSELGDISGGVVP